MANFIYIPFNGKEFTKYVHFHKKELMYKKDPKTEVTGLRNPKTGREVFFGARSSVEFNKFIEAFNKASTKAIRNNLEDQIIAKLSYCYDAELPKDERKVFVCIGKETIITADFTKRAERFADEEDSMFKDIF